MVKQKILASIMDFCPQYGATGHRTGDGKVAHLCTQPPPRKSKGVIVLSVCLVVIFLFRREKKKTSD